MRITKLTLSSLFISLALQGCYSGDEQDFLEAVELNELNITTIYIEATNTTTLEQNQIEPLIAMATVSDGDDIDITDRVSWRVSDTSVATINGNGELTGIADGMVEVNASLADLNGVLDFTVSTDPLVSIEIINVPVSADECTTGYQLSANGDYTLATETPGTDIRNINSLVTWSSDTPATATITENGLVTALTSGQSTITATHDGIDGTAVFDVADNLDSIALTPLSAIINEGRTQQFVATGSYGANQAIITNQITWSIANSDGDTEVNASISSTGLVTGLDEGLSEVTATCGGQQATADVTIEEPLTIDDIRIEAETSPPYQRTDGSLQLRAVLIMSDGSEGEDVTEDEDTTWSISSGTAATISNADGSEGLVSFTSTGDIQIEVRWAPEDEDIQSDTHDLTIQ